VIWGVSSKKIFLKVDRCVFLCGAGVWGEKNFTMDPPVVRHRAGVQPRTREIIRQLSSCRERGNW